MKQKKILVVLGGISSEREISLRSGKACIHALNKLKYKVLIFDPAKEHHSKIKLYKNSVLPIMATFIFETLYYYFF